MKILHPGFVDPAGFTLIELLVALVILGTVLMPSLIFVTYRLEKEHQSDEIIRGIEIAKATIEELTAETDSITDFETVIENKYILNIKVLDGDCYDEPTGLEPLEIKVTVNRLKDKRPLVVLKMLK